MAFLSGDFYKNLSNSYTERMKSTPGALAEQQKNQTNPITTTIQPFVDAFNPYKNYFKIAEQPPQVPGVLKSEGGFKIAPTPYATPETPVRLQPDISEAAQIKKFGGVVGSPEYLAKKLEHPYRSFLPMQVGSALGMRFPDVYTWDKMTFSDKASHVVGATGEAGIRLIFGLPEFIVKTIPSLASVVIRPIAEGTLSPKKLAESEKKHPYFLSDPIYTSAYEYYTKAKEAGRSDALATVAGSLMGGLEIFNRVLIGRGLYVATKSLVVPPKKLAPGETIGGPPGGSGPTGGAASAPILEALTKSKEKLAKEAGVVAPKDGPASIYLSHDVTTESFLRNNYKVSGGRIFTRITPAGAGKVEISVVQIQGPVQTGVTWAKKKIGINDQEFVRGMRGPEKKLESTIVNVEQAPKAAGITKAEPLAQEAITGGATLENLKSGLTVLDETIKSHPAFSLTKYATDSKTQLPEVTGKLSNKKVGEYQRRGDNIVNELGFKDTTEAAAAYEGLVKLRQQRIDLQAKIKSEGLKAGEKVDQAAGLASLEKTTKIDAQIEESLNRIKRVIVKPFPDTPLKGFENTPITRNQVENLSNIGRMNGIEPVVQDTLVRIFTGKSVVGDLTNAEYINVAKNLSTMNKMGEYSAGGRASLWAKYVGQKISPAYSWVESVQRRTGVPMEDARIDLTNGLRAQRTTQNAYFESINEIWGEYAKPKNIEYRRLIDAHRRGDAGAITNNQKLSPEIKSDLLKINEKISSYYEEVGPALNVPKEIHRKNEAGYYEPDVPDIGGITPKYKEGGQIGDIGEFSAKQKKEGGAFVFEDDAMKLMQGYARGGTYAKFVKPVVDRIKNNVEPLVPANFKDSYASTINEMLGYQGKFEKFLDDTSNILNQKLNRNLPPDLGRRVNQATFSYFYVNALDSPGTWTRNLLTNEALIYTKFGAEYWPQVQMKILDKAAWKEFRDSGYSNAGTNPYGADLGTVEGSVKKTAEVLLKPQSLSDDLGRFKAYWATKLQFENAIKLYNEGKLTWKQAENKLDLNGISPIVANRVRGQLLAKDMKGAFEELARNNINETNFPYGRGEGGRLTFGEAGHISTFLAKWNIHFTHEMGRLIRTGQFDKLIRYYTASVAIIESLKRSTGIDFSRSLSVGPVLGTSWPPSIQLGLDLIQGLKTQTMDNAEAIDENKDNIARTLKTFGKPGGVDTKNWEAFWRSYKNGPVDAQGRFNIITERGEVAEPKPVYFSDLFWRLMGMPTVSKVEASKLKRDITNYSYEVNQAKRKVAELRNAGKDDEANNIVDKWEAQGENVEPGNQSYDRFERSATERRFGALSPTGEAKFGERIYK